MALRAVNAEYESRCGICDQYIDIGDPIVNLDGEWIHADCAEEEGEEVSY